MLSICGIIIHITITCRISTCSSIIFATSCISLCVIWRSIIIYIYTFFLVINIKILRINSCFFNGCRSVIILRIIYITFRYRPCTCFSINTNIINCFVFTCWFKISINGAITAPIAPPKPLLNVSGCLTVDL